MDVDLLSKMIKELILDNDKVVLPGLGAFVAEIVPASFTDKGYTINPPYRRLSFRSKPDDGDLLIDFYASSNSLNHDVAEKVIRDFISELRSILYMKKVVVLPGLGRLRATKENAVFFICDEELDIYPEGFGLEPISLKTHQETREEVKAAVGELRAIVDEPVPAPVLEGPAEAPVEVQPVVAVAADQPEEHMPAILAEPEKNVPAVQAEPEHVPAVQVEQVVETEKVQEKEARPSAGTNRKWGKILLWLIILAVLLLIVFIGVSRMYPQLMDNILYSTEELEILNKI